MVQTYKVLMEINNDNSYHLRTHYVPTSVKNQSQWEKGSYLPIIKDIGASKRPKFKF